MNQHHKHQYAWADAYATASDFTCSRLLPMFPQRIFLFLPTSSFSRHDWEFGRPSSPHSAPRTRLSACKNAHAFAKASTSKEKKGAQPFYLQTLPFPTDLISVPSIFQWRQHKTLKDSLAHRKRFSLSHTDTYFSHCIFSPLVLSSMFSMCVCEHNVVVTNGVDAALCVRYCQRICSKNISLWFHHRGNGKRQYAPLYRTHMFGFQWNTRSMHAACATYEYLYSHFTLYTHTHLHMPTVYIVPHSITWHRMV